MLHKLHVAMVIDYQFNLVNWKYYKYLFGLGYIDGTNNW